MKLPDRRERKRHMNVWTYVKTMKLKIKRNNPPPTHVSARLQPRQFEA
jgi:hypothetical protein